MADYGDQESNTTNGLETVESSVSGQAIVQERKVAGDCDGLYDSCFPGVTSIAKLTGLAETYSTSVHEVL